ncbi:MAG: 2-dehydro-3-deoxy-D-arabinonate dehydratase [Limisphaerales bacterium]
MPLFSSDGIHFLYNLEHQNMNAIKLCRFKDTEGNVSTGILQEDGSIRDLRPAGIQSITEILEQDAPFSAVAAVAESDLPILAADSVELLTPVESQEIWAAGVTYQRSKTARMEESDFSASAYDLVYDAVRPEIFFKSMPEKVVGSAGSVGIRNDGKWNVPEPELVLVVNSKHHLVGYSIGNDMSSRDIEGENLLYLPQAKVYSKSCAIGPCLVLGPSEEAVRAWDISIKIVRSGQAVFSGSTDISQIKRSFSELIDFLCRSQDFPNGAMLLTGTGVVPPDEFTLAVGDEVRIAISGIGTLQNNVILV